MDSVRFGRALGIGARAAAKTLITAVDAATAPNPSAKPQAPSTIRPASDGRKVSEAAGTRTAQQMTRTVEQARRTTEGVARGGKRFGEAMWRPFVRLSGVLWLEFTGVFFGIFALYAASGAWKLRGEIHETATNHDAHMHFLMAATMALIFTYFCLSSFWRANRRGRPQ